MPLYLTRFSYTPETWARLIGHPEDRRKAAQSYIESVGGKLHGFWYAFGTHDGYTLWEAPDNVSMAAVVLAIGGGGALQLVGNDGPPDRRRNDASPAQGAASRLPRPRRVAARAPTPIRSRQDGNDVAGWLVSVGSTTSIVVPAADDDSIVTAPFCSSSRRRTIARPSPVPDRFVVKNGSKARP